MSSTVDLGPLNTLLGTWKGEGGKDVAPDPDGIEENAYYETLEFKVVGDVDNAEEQTLAIVQYEQYVRRKSNDQVLHHQLGYWTWDAQTQVVCNGFTIARRVAVLAGGSVEQINNETVFSVAAEKGSDEWGIIEAAFMRAKASTQAFKLTMSVKGSSLSYQQTMLVDIYGKKQFEHTDENTLTRV